MENTDTLTKYEKKIISNRISSRKYYNSNKEKIKERIQARYIENKDIKTLCKACGKEINKYNYNSHLKTKSHEKNIKNNSILQFVKFECE